MSHTTSTESKGSNYGYIIMAFFLLTVPIVIKLYAYKELQPALIETVIGVVNGPPKKELHYEMPIAFTVANIFADAIITLGCSFIISIFVVRKVEESIANKNKLDLEKLQSQIRENVISSVFGTLVDQEIFDVFRDGVITNGIVRKDAKWRYDFLPLADGKILFSESDRYDLYNRTGVNRIEVVRASYDNVTGQPTLKNFVCSDESGVILEFKYTDLADSTVEPGTRIACDGRVRLVTQEDGRTDITVEVSLKGKSKVSVSSLYETVYDGPIVNDSFFTSYPLVNAELEVNIPERYDFQLFTALSSDLQLDPVVQPRRRFYKAQGGILPNQGFVFSLKPLL